MSTQGTALLDFGATYKTDATIAVASAGIGSGSLVEAWLSPAATADHSQDEHVAVSADLAITCGPPNAGVGFTIYGVYSVPGGLAGKWNVSWVYN